MTVVDCHSHIFNAEDLPIDGFIRKHSPLPSLLTGALSLPFDKVLAWAAPGSGEAERLVELITAIVRGQEAPAGDATPGVDLPSDAEMEQRAVELWPLAVDRAPSLLEAAAGDPLADRIESASFEQLAELDQWLLESGDPDIVEALRRERVSGEEGVSDWLSRADGVRLALARFMALLRRVTRHRHLIAAELASTYDQVELFVPALVDFSYTTNDTPATDVPEQIAIHSLVSKLSVVGGIPGARKVRFHPMVGFCPLREVATSELATWDVASGLPNPYVPYAELAGAGVEDRYAPGLIFDPNRARTLPGPIGAWEKARLRLPAGTRSLDLVRQAVEHGGFSGVKLYPPSGFLPIGNEACFGERVGARLDAALHALYGYCEAMQVPILTHAAHSVGFAENFDDFAAPTAWGLVLEAYLRLRVCFGHFGHLYGVDAAGNAGPTSWVRRFVELIDSYDHVYADISNSQLVYKTKYCATYLAVLRGLLDDRDTAVEVRAKRRSRLMYGSDFWLNTLNPDHRDFFTVFADRMGATFGNGMKDAFLGGNALRWLGLTGEDDQPDPENLNRQRLAAFYGPHPLPAWLAPLR